MYNITIEEVYNILISRNDILDIYKQIEKKENNKYNTIEKLIEALDNTKINYDKSNYFVKKAKIIFEEKYKNIN